MRAKLLSDHCDGRSEKHIRYEEDADNDVVLISRETQIICQACRFCVAQVALVKGIEQVWRDGPLAVSNYFAGLPLANLPRLSLSKSKVKTYT